MSRQDGKKTHPAAAQRHETALSDAALDWIVTLHSGHAGEKEHAAWGAWRNQSPAHQAAAREAESIWNGLGTAAPRAQRQVQTRKVARRAVLGGGAAMLLAGVGMKQLGVLGPHLLAQHQTATGERRNITLQDGTDVVMNARTALTGQFSTGRRDVSLYRGQALFRIAEDAAGLFSVTCAETLLSCRSATVDVDFIDRSISVVVHSGQVEVVGAGGTRRLSAGQTLRVEDGRSFSRISTVDTEAASAWQRGKLIFEGRRLADLAAELERYRGGRVIVLEEELADLAVTGLFDLSEPEEILDTIQLSLPVQIRRLPLLAVIHMA